MLGLLQKRDWWSRFKKDTAGNLSLVWALGLTATVMSIGAGIDMSTATRVQTTAQAAADQVALHAAIFYSNNDRTPETDEEGYIDAKLYTADDTGFSFPKAVYNGDEGVKVKAIYDETNNKVSVSVSGQIETAFVGMFGDKFQKLDFKSEATANFKELSLKNPASIVLVLDNSGSMSWDDKPIVDTSDCSDVWIRTSRYYGYWMEQCDSPSGAESRIDGLKESVETFMDIIDGYVGPQTVEGKRALRTGMIPYDDAIITNREVEMDWGIITDSEIDSMRPSGATNSAPPISRAWEWMQDENDEHGEETGEYNPLRYMIFMTDGQNSAPRQWFAKAGTGYWRGIECTRYRWRNFCYYRYTESSTRPTIPNTSSWQEGEDISPSDRDSKNTCEAMKAQGVRVFTIGFALEPGKYNTNYGDGGNQTISDETTEAAYSMLANCASSPDDFVPAADVETLDEAFAVIGKSIVEDVVRLSL